MTTRTWSTPEIAEMMRGGTAASHEQWLRRLRQGAFLQPAPGEGSTLKWSQAEAATALVMWALSGLTIDHVLAARLLRKVFINPLTRDSAGYLVVPTREDQIICVCQDMHNVPDAIALLDDTVYRVVDLHVLLAPLR